MMRAFFHYPAGAAGLALLLLRASAAMLLAVGLQREIGLQTLWVITNYVVITALAVGYRTRIAAGAFAALAISLPGFSDIVLTPLVVTHALDAFALLLLGPGAFSLDAMVYGRRVVAVPGIRRH
jgi:hypothetical protein